MINRCFPVINGCVIENFCSDVAHEKLIPHFKENSEISTDVVDNDVIMLKFERVRQQALNFVKLYLSRLVSEMKYAKVYNQYFTENLYS